MAEHSFSPATSSATSPGTSPATSPGVFSSSSTSAGTTAAASTHSPFVFVTSPTTHSGSSPSIGSQFAPLFSSPAPPLSFATAPSPHPIFRDSIQNHIKFLLNPDEHNYHKWKSFFLLVLIRYGVAQFIEQPLPPNATAFHRELDAHLVLWIYSTLADNLVDHVVGATTTYDLWHHIRDYFLANRAARYMMLNRQYRNLKQGDLSVAEYARRMKLLTAGLADIDHAVTEVDLTTQFLHGIDKRLDTIRVVLGDTVPLPPFETVFSRLKLAEENLAQRVADEPVPILAVTGTSGSSNPRQGDRVDHNTERGPGFPQGRGSGNRQDGDRADRGGPGRGPGRGRGRGDHGGRDTPPPAAYNPYMGFFAPYGMALPTARPSWVPPNSAGVLGPRPGSHAQAYPMQLSSFHAPTSPQPPSWDHLAMLQAAYSASGYPNNGTAPSEWYLDSGAASHVTSNPGVNVVTGKWIFRHKFHPDGSLARYKARWVVRGFTQKEGVD
ncbi:uncharacterized protein [Aegilops tauschii subsp. strangulata]|uniref:uncharacterized protein n=1 Tax=Aegilops tauschii subsp. strangulata TaxID=200361 RepID=UPI003CC88666